MRRVVIVLMLSGAVASSPAWAQVSSEERPATASFWGDTGLWFVPTAEVVRPKGFSFSIYRTEFDFKQGLTDVSDWPVTGAVGVGGRAEVFGALRVVTRIDRDLRPLFQPTNNEDGGITYDRPFVQESWTGNDLGDLFVGTKVNMMSEQRNQPLALALRGTMKLPTADDDGGAGTGQFDYFGDVVVSKEVHRRVEISGFGGYAFRGDPSGVSLSDGFRWGFGAGWGARSNLRLTTEIFGEHAADNVLTVVPGTVQGADGSFSPILNDSSTGVTTAFGLTWQHRSGMSLGAGLTYQFGIDDEIAGIDTGSKVGMQFRLGFHNGVRVFVPPAPPARVETPPPAAAPVAAAPAPAPPAPAPNRQPSIRAQCNPCKLPVGSTSKILAESQDPDGDKLTYRWSTKAGTIGDPRANATTWTAETVPGTVVLTVTAEDGKGGVASTTVNIEVIGGAPIAFEDVQFDLDRADLRPDAIAVLDRAVAVLKQNPGVRLHIEGHASEEAPPDYNMALGDRRARAVQDYLVGQGIDASRLRTQSFGETRPKYDNSREETRRLNRRAALVADSGN